MDLATFTKESAHNRQAYQQLREHIRNACAGQYVALAHGKLIGTAGSFDAALDLVKRLDPAPEYYLVFLGDAEPDFDLIYELSWSL